ncbi:MAG TPA: hypothetical protein VFA10_10460 [Ktedonobacteraceae bacterium]|nr:hypothetical protein [Ktedonobacteraceae bacterium]
MLPYQAAIGHHKGCPYFCPDHPLHDWKIDLASRSLWGDILEGFATRVHSKLGDDGGHDQEACNQQERREHPNLR